MPRQKQGDIGVAQTAKHQEGRDFGEGTSITATPGNFRNRPPSPPARKKVDQSQNQIVSRQKKWRKLLGEE